MSLQTITVPLGFRDAPWGEVAVRAKVADGLAIHRSVCSENAMGLIGYWTVSHALSGQAIVRYIPTLWMAMEVVDDMRQRADWTLPADTLHPQEHLAAAAREWKMVATIEDEMR